MNPTIASLALQALLGQRRIWVLLALPTCLIGLAIALIAIGGDADSYAIVGELGYPIVLPLVALFATSCVLGPEIEDGSIVYLLSKPVNRYVVAASKYVVAWAATMVTGVAPLVVAGIILDRGSLERSLAWGVGAAVAGTAYSALFLALSALTRHAVVIGLFFVLLWEGALGGLLTGIAWVSVGQWGVRVVSAVDDFIRGPELPLAYAIIAAAVVTVAGLWVAGDRLRSFAARGDE